MRHKWLTFTSSNNKLITIDTNHVIAIKEDHLNTTVALTGGMEYELRATYGDVLNDIRVHELRNV